MNRMKSLQRTSLVLLAASLPALAGRADAQVTTAPSLPDAVTLLDAYRASLGEPETLANLKTLRVHGKVYWEGEPGKGFLTEVYAGLRRARITTDFAVFGTFEMGTDGTVVWETTPLGVTIREGWDACQYMRDFGLAQNVDWREMYEKARCVGTKEIDGELCWELQLYPKMLVEATPRVAAQTPPPDVWYLNAETHLPRRVHAKSVGVFDEPIELVLNFTDWRVVEGVRYPHRVEAVISGFTMNIDYESFEANVEVPDSYFDLGEEVRMELTRQRDPQHRTKEQAIRIETLDERHIVSIRVTCAMADMQKTLSVLLPETMQHVMASGGTPAGQPLVRYHNWGDPIDLEAGIPVTAAVASKGRVKAETLPAGMAVVAWHVGPYHELPRTHKKITAFVEERGLVLRGAAWEEYWTDPGMEPDPSKWRTKVVWPVKKK